ncbi:ABC transporter permease [Paenibacillus sp. 1011MAR3C5]|uniref:ABC transporter permease n=1 Tax=Paenibacillus sp. 1011MAR3C5 TaxID=1675787 RepID=UPI000E6BCEC4|nr:ABC transporter permease [Paenibacillus sp. 1011MAR3C5]RJE90134.1 ABC transporter permease [Paenibacillus sp. 1011MAR3C5]
MMFPNSNAAIIRKLIRRNIKFNRSRNRYIILAVMLTTWLLTSVFSIGMSYMKSFELQELRLIGTKADAYITNPTAEQLAKLEELPYVTNVGLDTVVAMLIHGPESEGRFEAAFHRYDAEEWEALKAPLQGKHAKDYPSKRGGAIFPAWVLQQMGIDKPLIGMDIPVSYRYMDGGQEVEQSETLKLAGWYDDYTGIRSDRPGAILVASDFVTAGEGSSYVRIASVLFGKGASTDRNIERLEKELAPSDGQVLSGYRHAEYNDSASAMATTAGVIGLILFVMFSGYLLIYNMLYISITTNTKYYGLLKTIGMTGKQIRRMVNGEALRLAWIGIAGGLVLGAATSLLAVPAFLDMLALETEAELSFHPAIYGFSAVFALLTTLAGYRKPARLAAKISPIEASKYERATVRRGGHGAKLHRMALRNIFRDKKRAFTVFTSLFLGLSTFLVVNTIIISMNTDNFIEQYVEDDFAVTNGTLELGYQGETKQRITAAIMEEIRAMQGITDIRTTFMEYVELEYDPAVFGRHIDAFASNYRTDRPTDETLSRDGMFMTKLMGIDSDYVRELNATTGSAIDVERFEKGEIALLGSDTASFSNGDSFGMKLQESGEHALEIGGTVPSLFLTSSVGIAPGVYVSDIFMKQLIEDPIAYKMSLSAQKEHWPAIQANLERMTGGMSNLELSSKQQWASMMKSAKTTMYVLGGALSLILALIGLLNFVGTMFTNVYVRGRELAVMESIGMTKKQLRMLLVWEGAGYAFLSILLISTLGTLLGYGAFRLFSMEADYAVFTYPYLPLSFAFVLVLAVCMAVPLMAYQKFKRLTIVERLREAS